MSVNVRYNGHKTVTIIKKKNLLVQPYAEFNCLSRAIFKIQNGQMQVLNSSCTRYNVPCRYLKLNYINFLLYHHTHPKRKQR